MAPTRRWDPSESGGGIERLEREVVMATGIVAHGAYVPKNRLPLEEVRRFWGGLSTPAIKEKAFPSYDEDPVTMGVEAGRQALERSPFGAEELGAIFFATTSGPYEEKPNVSTIASALTGSSRIRVVEMGGSPRAGLQALLSAWEFSASWGKPAMAIASDAPIAHPASSLEHGLGAGAAAFVIGEGEGATTLEAVESISVETFGERFRRRGQSYLQDLELRQDELTGSVLKAIEGLMGGARISLSQVEALVLPDPDGGTPARIAKALGASPEKLLSLTPRIGDTGAASVPLGLIAALEKLEAGKRILVCSYGAGADATSWIMGEASIVSRQRGRSLEDILERGRIRSYGDYLKLRGFLVQKG